MTKSTISATFPISIEKLWNIVTNLNDYSWRSDVHKIEVVNKEKFIEYTPNNYATTFTITSMKPHKRWEFDMENDNMSGHWIGVFHQNGLETKIDFTEEITVKKVWMKPFIKKYLKKQQQTYIKDLEKAIKGLVE